MYRITFYGINTCGEVWKKPVIYEFDTEQEANTKYDEILTTYKPLHFDHILLEEVHKIKEE